MRPSVPVMSVTSRAGLAPGRRVATTVAAVLALLLSVAVVPPAVAAGSPVTGLTVTTNYDGASVPNAVDANASNGLVATNDAVGFSWRFVTQRALSNATITQTLPVGWSWDASAVGALTANISAYQSMAVISADLRTLTATFSSPVGTDVTLGPLRANVATAADGGTYTPQVDISDVDGSDSASGTSVQVVSGAPQYTVAASATVSISTAGTVGGQPGQVSTARVVLSLPPYLGQPNTPLPAGSVFTVTTSNISAPTLMGGSGPATVSQSGNVTTFTTTAPIAPGGQATFTAGYGWQNTALPSTNSSVGYTFAPVSMAGFGMGSGSAAAGYTTIKAGNAPGVGTWRFSACPAVDWSGCVTLMNWNQAPNPLVALDAQLTHSFTYTGALNANALSVPESAVTLTSTWNSGAVQFVDTVPIALTVTAGGVTRVPDPSEYTVEAFVGGVWTVVPTLADVTSAASGVQVTVRDPWAADLGAPKIEMSVHLRGVATHSTATSIYGAWHSPSTSGSATRAFRLAGISDSTSISVNKTAVTAPDVLRYTTNLAGYLPIGGTQPQSSGSVTITQTFPADVLQIVPVGLDPSWTMTQTVDASNRIIATFVHDPFTVTSATNLPPIVIDATLSPIAPASGAVYVTAQTLVQNGTSGLSGAQTATAGTVVHQAQVIALTATAAKRHVEATESPLSWTVTMQNFKPNAQGQTYAVGVLPHTGDAGGSHFGGTIEFGAVNLCTMSGTSLEYSTDSPAAIAARAADDPASGWTAAPGGSLAGTGATAFRIVINDFGVASTCSLNFDTTVSGNAGGDRYALTIFGTSAVGGPLPTTVPTLVDVVSSSLSGRVVEDPSASGTYSSGLAGFADATVELLSSAGTVLRTTTTASDGSYSFEGLASGAYRLHVVPSSLPAGSTATFAPSQPLTLGVGASVTTAHLGFIDYDPRVDVSESHVLPTTIAAGETLQLQYVVTNNGNGTLNPLTISGITLGTPTYVWPATPNVLAPGASMTITVPHVLTQAEVDAGLVIAFVSVNGQDPAAQTALRSLSVPISLAGTPELTVTKSGTFSGVSLVGAPVQWSIEVVNSGSVTLTNVTVADALPGLSALAYTWPSGGPVGQLTPGQSVAVTASSPLTAAQVAAGSVTNTATASGVTPQSVTVDSDPASATVTLPAGSIAGRIVEDPTSSGVSSPSLDGFAGVTVELRDGSSTVVASAVTAVSGGYTFPGLPAGTFTVHVVESGLPAGSASTFAPASSTITLATDQQVTGVDFGYIVFRPGLTLTQSAVLPALIVPGEVVHLTYVVRNTGNGPLTSVQVGAVESGASTYSWPGSAGDLAVGEAVTVTVDHILTAQEIAAGALVSAFTASGLDPVSQSTSGSSSVSVSLTGSPSLSVSAAGTFTGIATVGAPLSWTFEVTNTGTVTMTSVSVAGTVSGLSALQYTWPGTPGVLAPGQSATATATSSVTASQWAAHEAVNTVTASGATPQSTTITSPSTTATVALPSGSIAGRVVEDPTASGVMSAGLSGLAGITVQLRSTAGALLLTTTTAADGAYSFGGLPAGDYGVGIDATSLPAGASATFVAPSPVTVGAGAEVTGVDFGLILYEPALQITQSHVLPPTIAAGQTITVTYVVTNTGNGALSGVTAGGALLASGTPAFAWPGADGDLAPGQSVTITVDRVLTQADIDSGALVSAVTAAGTDPVSQQATAASTVSIVVAAAAGLAVTKSGDFSGLTVVGGEVQWTIEATNSGAVTLSNVTIDDSLVGLTPLQFTWPGGVAGVLAPGQTVTATTTSALTEQQILDRAVTNTATARATTPLSAAVVSAPASATVSLPRPEGITLSLTSTTPGVETPPGPTVTAGTPISWTYTVTNTGSRPVSDVQIIDSAGAIPTLVSPSDFAGVIEPGETVVFASSSPALPGSQTQEASVTASVDSDADPASHLFRVGVEMVTLHASATAYYTGVVSHADGSDSTGGLARTGMDVAPALFGAAGMILLGLVIAAARRRRTGERAGH